MGTMNPQPSQTPAAAARELLEATLPRLVAGDPALTKEAARPPAEAKPWLDDLLGKVDTYRDGMLALLAFPVATGHVMDLTAKKVPGARGVAQRVAELLNEHDIPGRKDALQTIAKGSPNYMGRDREAWNQLLQWASKRRRVDVVRRAWLYLLAGVAATARTLPPLPRIDTTRLTFPATAALFDELLSTPSNGAHEQFLFAALLEAYIEQLGIRANERVATKSLTAADASASAAGDIQHLAGGQVLEAYEVTANDWDTKIVQAVEVLNRYDLARVHIVGAALEVDAEDIANALPSPALDVSVLDIRHEVRSLNHRLLKPARRSAIERLYDHLVHRQPREDLVALLVDVVTRRGLVEPTG
jgi:hypothetical protein